MKKIKIAFLLFSAGLLLGNFNLIAADGVSQLVHAEGKIFYHEVYITWSIENEENGVEYIVEGSAEGKDWRIRGRVRSGRQLGSVSEYKFVDKKGIGLKYYRIRLIGSRSGSRVLSKFTLDNYSIQVSLEAVSINDQKKLILDYSVDQAQQLMIRIYNSIGEQVLTKLMPFEEAGDFIFHMNISDLPSGNYLLTITQVLLDKTVAEKSFTIK